MVHCLHFLWVELAAFVTLEEKVPVLVNPRYKNIVSSCSPAKLNLSNVFTGLCRCLVQCSIIKGLLDNLCLVFTL